MNNVVVFGGSGFVGKNLAKVRPDWRYFGSKVWDAMSLDCVLDILDKFKPEAVINLAGRVGGIKANSDRPGEFFYENATIGMNIIEGCRLAGIPRLLTSISTCAFPDTLQTYPMLETDLHLGPPAITNFSYGYSKRILQVMTSAYRQQYGLNYSCFAPSNIYGPEDNFDPETSHFVPACIRKFCENKEVVELWGDGSPKRQQLFVKDLARAIPILLEKHNTNIPLIVSPNENLSIRKMAETIKEVTGSEAEIRFNGQLNGQLNKECSNILFRNMAPEFEFTTFLDGVTKTHDWYINR